MEKPVIGILGRIRKEQNEEIIISDDIRYSFINKGAIPILILPMNKNHSKDFIPFCNNLSVEEKKDLKKVISMCDGIVIPGGSQWFGMDQFVYEVALQKNIPVLGICLGMQLMANQKNFKETMSDKTIEIQSSINHKTTNSNAHEVIFRESMLKNIFRKDVITVNSRHRTQIQDSNEFLISSTSKDGVIESIEIPDQDFAIGVQWHPENLYDISPIHQKIFEEFVKRCQKKKVE